jgi:hypothetical protein
VASCALETNMQNFSLNPRRDIKGEKRTVFIILFSAFPAVKEKENSPLPPPLTERRQQTLCTPPRVLKVSLRLAGEEGGKGGEKAVLASPSLPQRGEPRKLLKNGTLFVPIISKVALSEKLFADSFPGRD